MSHTPHQLTADTHLATVPRPIELNLHFGPTRRCDESVRIAKSETARYPTSTAAIHQGDGRQCYW